MFLRLRWILSVLIVAACGDGQLAEPGPNGEPPADGQELRAEEVASGLASPLYLTAPGGDSRLFVVEQAGRIRVVENGQLLPTPFLDIRQSVVAGGERGLLSIAFHPQYGANGYFFVSYTGSGGTSRVERYRVSADRNRADPESGDLILAVPQPFANHNGGLIKFGPDGMLYVGLGDGGSGGDPQEHGQNRSTLLGAMLRINVDLGDPYSVPSDNPYLGIPGARPEIWAIGLRNPWRFSFDQGSGLLYIADVGQNRREEINARPSTQGGLNYGWNIMEGSLCFRPQTGCDPSGLVLPVFEYDNPAEGCSVTGGYVYRGQAMPALRGHYFFGDYCRGEVRSFRLTEEFSVSDARTWSLGPLGNIASFGEDAVGELYVVNHQGRVFRLAPT